MKHLFVPYALALLFKEKGFDTPCLARYDTHGEFVQNPIGYMTNWNDDRSTSAPLYQQVVDYFRNEKLIVLDVFQEYGSNKDTGYYTGKWEVDISELGKYKFKPIIEIEEVFDGYYAALNHGIESILKII